MPPLQFDVLEAYRSDMSARVEVGKVRVRDMCSRALAIERADILEEQRAIMTNPGHRRLCSHMHSDLKCVSWTQIVKSALSVREVIYMVVLLVLCSPNDASEALRVNRMLHLQSDDEWGSRLERLLEENLKFFETITRQDRS